MRSANKAALYVLADVTALQALSRGEADEDQQRRALRWIVHVCSETYEPSYRETDRETAFVEGRRSVGIEVTRLLNMPHEVKEALKHG